MLLPISWLSDFVELELDPEELANELTMKGTEVEAIHQHRVSGVLVGEVLSVDPHPNADRLTICSVDLGREEPSTIVCGAPNVAAGQRVAVAPPGAELPGGFKIKARKMRGVASEGMVLAEDELGIGDDHSGILVIEEELPIGSELGAHIPLCDTVLELSVNPNRGDCLSLYGIARELHAITGAPIFTPATAALGEGEADLRGRIRVDLEDAEGAPRYLARVVEEVRVRPSPLLWRVRLHRAGLRPINAIVDATNITLLELGQPQHAFDLRHFPTGRVVVRTSAAKEPFVTLDEQVHELPEGLVLIASEQAPVALAGVMGGLDSAVTAQTREILVESAYFKPSAVRRASSILRISSEAAYRFERGVDPELVPLAAARTAHLIAAHAGGRVVAGEVDAYPVPFRRRRVKMRGERLKMLLGYEIPAADTTRILDRLGLAPEAESEDNWLVQVPSHRHDLEREVDLIEEVARIHGYERIPETSGLAGPAPLGLGRADRVCLSLERALVGLGFAGTVGNSLISPADLKALRWPEEEAVRLNNPLGEDQSLMRPSLLPSLLAVAQRNLARGRAHLRLFEVGKVFQDLGGKHERGAEQRFVERNVLTLLAVGQRSPQHWSADAHELDFYDARGVAEYILGAVGAPALSWLPKAQPFLVAELAAAIHVGQQEVGWIGVLDPALAQHWDLSGNALLAHLELDRLVPLLATERHYREPSRFPASRRDLSMLVPPGLRYAKIEERIQQVAKRNLQSVEVFDLYEGEPLEPGQRSLALRITYRAQDRTLTDKEIKESQDQIIAALQQDLGVVIRGA